MKLAVHGYIYTYVHMHCKILGIFYTVSQCHSLKCIQMPWQITRSCRFFLHSLTKASVLCRILTYNPRMIIFEKLPIRTNLYETFAFLVFIRLTITIPDCFNSCCVQRPFILGIIEKQSQRLHSARLRMLCYLIVVDNRNFVR